MSDHANFAPSSAHRWVVCQQSLQPVEAEHYIAREDDEFSKDGSAKHSLAKWALLNGQQSIDALLQELSFHGMQVTTQMVEAADIYVNYIEQLQSEDRTIILSWYEERVYIEDVHEDMYGTLDVALYSESKRMLTIGDAKFGWEAVEADGNWQLRAYAIGKTRELEDLGYEVETIRCFICQPADSYEPIKSVTYTRAQLKKFASTMKRATKGHAAKAGDHCKRCPRAHLCETLDTFVREVAEDALTGDPATFSDTLTVKTPEQIAAILDRKEAIAVWLKGVEAWGKQLILLKQDVPGYYLKGGQGHRAYRDPDHAEKVLLHHFGDGIYESRALRSPAQIEKIWPPAKQLFKGTEGQPGLCYRPDLDVQLKRKK